MESQSPTLLKTAAVSAAVKRDWTPEFEVNDFVIAVPLPDAVIEVP